MRRVRHRRGGFGLMLLLYQIYNTGFDRIPPVTLATVGAQVAIYLRLLKKLPKHKDVCISTVHVWYRHEWKRLALGAFYHADDWHLYYNMASFLWKGMTLERKFGSPYFFYLLAVLTVVVNMTTVALGFAADRLLHDPSYLTACAVGFSGVIFALKVITTHSTPPGVVRVMGFLPVHSRWSCWLELALIQLLVPNASFVGHLAGILVGLAYVKGPLRNIMDYFVPADLTYAQAGRNARYRDGSDAGSRSYGARPSYTYRSGSTGYNTRRSANPGLRYNVAPHDRPGMSEEEQVQEAMRRSRGDYESSSHGHHRTDRPVPSAPLTEEFSSPNLYPDLRNVGGYEGNPPDTGYGWREEVTNRNANLEEVRRRRLARFDR